jgi:hypothetical protein
MSYLHPVRIHFAGQFRADVSTVNNYAPHYDIETFKIPDDQLPGNANGWWQPAGTGAWRLDRCRVTAAVLDGKAVPADPVVGLEIRDTGDRVSAKLVDLDPDQQMVSMIFGLEVRIVDPVRKKVLMRADFEPAPFYDIWTRALAGSSGDAAYSAYYQSVLTGVEWGDLEGSAVLQALQAATEAGFLSIKFNVDSYSMKGARRGFGRIVGTIGPQLAAEPHHFTPGRYLAPVQPQVGTNAVNYVGCWVDPQSRQVIVDFGNALHTGDCGLANVGPLRFGATYTDSRGNPLYLDLGRLDGYSAAGWYERTAGIAAFPADRPMTDAELQIVAANPLCVAGPLAAAPFLTPLAAEAADGIFARPDLFVFRMEPNSSQDVPVMVLQFGSPLADAEIGTTVFSLSVTEAQDGSAPPAGALTVSNAAAIATDVTGWATVTLATTDPGWPRTFIDGEVYGVNLAVTAGGNAAANAGTSFSPSCFISVLAFSKVEVAGAVTWANDVQPILQQYSNLYPRPHGPDRYVPYAGEAPLHPVVNLSNEAEVGAFAAMIRSALELPIGDPNHMPVTRDLSEGRRRILLDWVGQQLAAPEAAAAAAPPPGLPAGPPQAPKRDFAVARAAAAAPAAKAEET